MKRALSETDISAKAALKELEQSREAVDFCVHLITTFAGELQESFERRQAA
jgi:hypothetical protein